MWHTGFLMEYMPGGSLDTCLDEKPGEFTVDRVQKWAFQIARALTFCHEVLNIIHRDIKPSNVLLSEDYETAKIGDFGLVREDEDESKTVMITNRCDFQFQAPEMSSKSNYSTKADVYSYGCLLYAIIYKKRNLFEETKDKLSNRLKNGEKPELEKLEKERESLLKHLKPIIEKCWKQKPEDRPTMKKVVKDIIESK